MILTEATINEKMQYNRRYVGILSADERMEFAKRVSEGINMEKTEALRLLVDGYMEYSGVSAGFRTLYYDAGNGILQEFLESDSPLAKELNEQGVFCLDQCMGAFNPEYTDEYGEYDVVLMKGEEYLRLCVEECSYNIPEPTKAALCYGLYLQFFDR